MIGQCFDIRVVNLRSHHVANRVMSSVGQVTGPLYSKVHTEDAVVIVINFKSLALKAGFQDHRHKLWVDQ